MTTRSDRTTGWRLDTSSSYFYLGLAFLPVGVVLLLSGGGAGLPFTVLGAVFMSQALVRREPRKAAEL